MASELSPALIVSTSVFDLQALSITPAGHELYNYTCYLINNVYQS